MKNREYLRISYDLEPNAPIFKGNPPNRFETVDSIEQGATWNSYYLKLFTHNGTHIDAPNHFDGLGKKIADFGIDDFIYQRPQLIEVPKAAGESLTIEEVSGSPDDCDLLLIRTGFSKRRGDEIYVMNNPWLSPEAAAYIRRKYKRLKAVGIDTISIASPLHPGPGTKAHQNLLGNGSQLVIIEDLNLGAIDLRVKPKRVFAIPLFAGRVDSMPCTAFLELKDE